MPVPEQVVGEGVAGEALDDGQQRQDGADHPVDLARLAEGTGEEDRNMPARGDDEHQAQWWIWRMIRPPLMSNEMLSVEA